MSIRLLDDVHLQWKSLSHIYTHQAPQVLSAFDVIWGLCARPVFCYLDNLNRKQYHILPQID